MKKATFFLFSLTLLCANISFGQNHYCGTDEYTEKLMLERGISPQDMKERIMRIVQHQPSMSRVGPYTIPVVVHVLHDNGYGDISEVQIKDAIAVLNEDYNRLNADSIAWRNSVEAPFQPNVGDIEITFKLARLDPQGNCTNGIVRVNAPHLTFGADDDVKSSANGGSDSWDVSMYMNIWVVNSISGSGQGTTLGYATLPYFGISNNAGIVIRNDVMGRIGTSFTDGRTLTHEAGHFLGLLHTFQGPFGGGGTGCHTTDCYSSGDFICDTPPAEQATYTCNSSLNTCTTPIPVNSPYGVDVNDMIENYMSYDQCQNMFTNGQKARMWSVLDSTAFPEYNNLVSASNAIATGINQSDLLCEIDFSIDKKIICAGESVEFADRSFNLVTSRTWSFPGGSASSTTDSIVTVTYNTPGIYNVELSVSDGNTSLDSTATDLIIVLDNPGARDNLYDDFDGYSSFPDYDKWVTVDNGNGTFEITNLAAVSGSKSLYLPIYGSSGERTDDLISGVYDFSNAPIDSNFYISFKYAYKNRISNSSSSSNSLRIYISQDCGNSWGIRKVISGNNFGNGVLGGAFVPTDQDWLEDELTLPVSQVQFQNFRFRFEVNTEEANNFFLEDVNVYIASQSHLKTNEFKKEIGMTLFPNPADDQVILQFDNTNNQTLDIYLLDVSGRYIKSLFQNEKFQGGESKEVDISDLTAGIYLIKIESKYNQQIAKLIVE